MLSRRHFLGGTLATLALGFLRADASTPPGPTKTSWPMFRGGPELTGVSPASLPNDLKLLWTAKTGGPVKSSPAILDGKVFIGSDDMKLHALSLADGKSVWEFKTEAPIEAAPLVLDGKVYVGSTDNALYAVEAKDGKQVWKYATEDKILGAPNWTKSPDGKENWILAGSYDTKLHCVSATTGKKVWDYETGNYINGCPAVSDGATVFGGCDALLHMISVADGKKVKEMDAEAYIAGSAAVTGNRAYVGHYENVFLCFDLTAQKILWRYKDRAFAYFSSPAITKDFVVFGGRDKRLHCVKKDTGEGDSSPVVIGDKIIVGSDDGRLYLVSLKDGSEIWNYEIGQPVTSSPAVVDNRVVVGCEDGNVYCFGKK
jgi:eukaryotic-like serine/threonine-protein kinase